MQASHGPRVAASDSCTPAKKDCVEEEVQDDEVNDLDSDLKRQKPNDSDMTFGSIPRTASLSQNYQLEGDKLKLLSNRKLKWKLILNADSVKVAVDDTA